MNLVDEALVSLQAYIEIKRLLCRRVCTDAPMLLDVRFTTGTGSLAIVPNVDAILPVVVAVRKCEDWPAIEYVMLCGDAYNVETDDGLAIYEERGAAERAFHAQIGDAHEVLSVLAIDAEHHVGWSVRYDYQPGSSLPTFADIQRDEGTPDGALVHAMRAALEGPPWS